MKRNKNKIVAIIPAKAYSKRLPNKNMVLIDGRPLLYYTIKTAKGCKLIDKIFVSTDSTEIAEFARREGVSVIERPHQLCAEAPVVEVYRHALMNTDDTDVTYVVGLQPDHPDRTADLEETIKYALEKDLDDLISVDLNGHKNGSIRIMKADALREGRLSVNFGSIMDNSTNIHTLKDLRLAQIRLKQNESPLSIRVKGKTISRQSPAFIVAEGACNHMCDINLAKKMIDEAESAGADAIKFQTYKAERLVKKDATIYWDYNLTKSQYEYYKNLDKFDRKEYRILFDYVKDRDIVVFSSPCDIESTDMLHDLGMPLFKIPSCLITHKRLINHIAKFKKPIILSTGGSGLEEIQEAVDIIYQQDNYYLVIMACTLNYPAENKNAHLMRIRKLTELFPEAIIGYSDHTEPDDNMIIPSLAVGLGAKVIEKHFTLDRSMTGSGHSFSIDPALLKRMVQNIRLAEEVLGKEELRPSKTEEEVRKNARMSIVARRDIKKNEVIAEDMLTFKRPGTGISPKFIDEVLGRKIKKDLQADEQISWEDLD